jgi:hypothetical protein
VFECNTQGQEPTSNNGRGRSPFTGHVENIVVGVLDYQTSPLDTGLVGSGLDKSSKWF